MQKLTQSMANEGKHKFPAQPKPPQGQFHIGNSDSMDSFQEQVQAVTTLRSGKTIEKVTPQTHIEPTSTFVVEP